MEVYAQGVTLAYVNFELFVYREMTPSLLWALGVELSALFASTPGRCELRYGTVARKLMLDFGLPSDTAPQTVCEAVARVLGRQTTVFLHKGKHQVDVTPLVLSVA